MFSAIEPDPGIEVILDVDFLLHPAWPDLSTLVMRPDGADPTRRVLQVVLPPGLECSYRFLRRPVGRRRSGHLDELRALLGSGQPDPANHERISNAFDNGTTASVLVLPDALRHPAWDRGTSARHAVARHRVDLGDRAATLLVGPAPTTALAVFLDGDLWTDSLDLARVLARWRRTDLAVLAVPTPERERLPERTWLSDLVVSRALPRVAALLGGMPERVAAVGQSYGGLAAAGLVVDHREQIGTAVISSGSFWYNGDDESRDSGSPGPLIGEVAGSALIGARFLVHVGAQEREMVDLTGLFAAAATRAGADVQVQTRPGGHDHAWYRHAIVEALEEW